jgi:hypothetical protein
VGSADEDEDRFRRVYAAHFAAGEGLLAEGKPDQALPLYRKAAEAGDHGAVEVVVNWPGVRDDPAAMEAVYRTAIAAGDVSSLPSLAMLRARLGDALLLGGAAYR